ncbi:MAG: peptide chain release factor N(5)-glutamine methyltransferase [Gammaproteobacteria bacterium]|nr:peptide chain release factor N(5)-glutamine methyltransferase [Gammaproteobacteria bacterium]
MQPGTLQSLLAAASASLASTSDSPRLDAELLLAHALGQDRSYLRAWPERVPAPAQAARFASLLARRQAGEPVAHLLGVREFWSLELQVTPDTLIPRPETELLVERALLHIPADRPATVADLGTGSGAIALAIASERPRARVLATDRAAAALAVARRNAAAHAIDNVEFQEGDWCKGMPADHFDVILSNPPYIAAGDPHLAQGDARFDPRSALVSGPDGLDDLRLLIPAALACLKPGGWLLVEHGYDQGAELVRLFEAAGYQDVQDHADLADKSRMIEGKRPYQGFSQAGKS